MQEQIKTKVADDIDPGSDTIVRMECGDSHYIRVDARQFQMVNGQYCIVGMLHPSLEQQIALPLRDVASYG